MDGSRIFSLLMVLACVLIAIGSIKKDLIECENAKNALLVKEVQND